MNLELVKQWNSTEPSSLQKIIVNNSITDIGKNKTKIDNNPLLFNNEINKKVSITDQKSSGRCWLFATCNLIRQLMMDKVQEFNDIDFELSQSYLFFYDKLERYHRLLKYSLQIEENETDKNKKERYWYNLLKDPLSDGGQWNMAKEIVKKYGIVPKSVYNDSFHAKSTSGLNAILTTQLVNDIETLKEDNSLIDEMMHRVYNILVSFLGKPPNKFTYEFKHKDNHYRLDSTPLEFLKKININYQPYELNIDLDEFVNCVNDPRNEYHKYYEIKYLGNVYDKHVGWFNITTDEMMQMMKEMIDVDCPIWFGCNVSAERISSEGIADIGIIDYSLFGLQNRLCKRKKLTNFLSVPNHAMLISGYHIDILSNEILRWKVENSWGKSSGKDGYLIMTNDWMKEYTFQILVKKDIFNKIVNVNETELMQDIKVVEPWDPLGTLA